MYLQSNMHLLQPKLTITNHLKTVLNICSINQNIACENDYLLFQKHFDADKHIVFLCFLLYSDDRVSTNTDLWYCQRSSCSSHHLVWPPAAASFRVCETTESPNWYKQVLPNVSHLRKGEVEFVRFCFT